MRKVQQTTLCWCMVVVFIAFVACLIALQIIDKLLQGGAQ